MASQDWSIKIVPSGSSVAFQPDVPGAKPGDPLQAQDADLISWNNRTGASHWPWAIDPTTGEPFVSVEAAKDAGLYLSDNVPPWESSTDTYVTTAPPSGSTTIDYICKNHPNEKGQIIVSAS
jgi:plastocyanin